MASDLALARVGTPRSSHLSFPERSRLELERRPLNSALVSLPILLLIWSVFSDDPMIQEKIDIFFDKFANLPFWYQSLFIGIVASIYGLKGADIFKKK